MQIELGTPALLLPAIAILMLGYVNRYISTAGVIRAFKKDYDTGYVHAQVVTQIKILRKRIEFSRYMLLIGVIGMILACLAMLFIFVEMQIAGKLSFGFALGAMVVSMVLSAYETSLSNKSIMIEIDDILVKERSSAKH